jgi:hypothetical protein
MAAAQDLTGSPWARPAFSDRLAAVLRLFATMSAAVWRRLHREEGSLLEEDRPQWEAARTLPELAALTVRWLTGEIRSQPGYYGPVDVDEPDAPGLTAALIACNRAGFLTNDSQAGYDGSGYDDALWTQLAAVTGFLHPSPAAQLAALVAADGRFRIQHTGEPEHIPVTCRDGVAGTWYGGETPAYVIADLYEGCGPDAINDVIASATVTVWDPIAGRNDLWEFLSTAAVHLAPGGRE